MNERDKIRDYNNKQLAKWICENILLEKCDEGCPLANDCHVGHNAVEEILDKEIYGIKDYECVGCKKILDCKGRPIKAPCLFKE